MRSVDKARDYKKDFQRESAGRYRIVLTDELPDVIALLANDLPLPKRYYDHELIGCWAGHRDCHIRSDLLLIYMKIGDAKSTEESSGVLRLVRLGSHSELFG